MEPSGMPLQPHVAQEFPRAILAGQPKAFAVSGDLPGYHIVVIAHQYLEAVALVTSKGLLLRIRQPTGAFWGFKFQAEAVVFFVVAGNNEVRLAPLIAFLPPLYVLV